MSKVAQAVNHCCSSLGEALRFWRQRFEKERLLHAFTSSHSYGGFGVARRSTILGFDHANLMETVLHHLHANAPEIMERQKQAIALRAGGLTVKEVARELKCSPHVAQTLLNRAADTRLDIHTTDWLAGLPHRAARALLAHGYKAKEDVAKALARGDLTSDQPGIGKKTMEVLADWLAET